MTPLSECVGSGWATLPFLSLRYTGPLRPYLQRGDRDVHYMAVMMTTTIYGYHSTTIYGCHMTTTIYGYNSTTIYGLHMTTTIYGCHMTTTINYMTVT